MSRQADKLNIKKVQQPPSCHKYESLAKSSPMIAESKAGFSGKDQKLARNSMQSSAARKLSVPAEMSHLVISAEEDEEGNLLLVRRRRGRTLASKGSERTWIKVGMNPPQLRNVALRTFTHIMIMNPSVVVQGAVAAFGNTDVQYGYLIGGADWLTVFDAYRIEEVQVTVTPTYTVGVVGMVLMPNITTVIDYDDVNAITLAQMREFSNNTVTTNQTVVRSFVPHVNMDSSAIAAAYSVPAPWIDAASTTIPHYGFKSGIDATVAGQTVVQEYTVAVRCRVSFRTSR